MPALGAARHSTPLAPRYVPCLFSPLVLENMLTPTPFAFIRQFNSGCGCASFADGVALRTPRLTNPCCTSLDNRASIL